MIINISPSIGNPLNANLNPLAKAPNDLETNPAVSPKNPVALNKSPITCNTTLNGFIISPMKEVILENVLARYLPTLTMGFKNSLTVSLIVSNTLPILPARPDPENKDLIPLKAFPINSPTNLPNSIHLLT